MPLTAAQIAPPRFPPRDFEPGQVVTLRGVTARGRPVTARVQRCHTDGSISVTVDGVIRRVAAADLIHDHAPHAADAARLVLSGSSLMAGAGDVWVAKLDGDAMLLSEAALVDLLDRREIR